MGNIFKDCSLDTIRTLVLTTVIAVMATIAVGKIATPYETVTAQAVDSTTTQALIKEIKELRSVLEKVVSSNTQNQFLIERTRLQKSIIDELNQEHQRLQESIESDSASIQEALEVESQLEKQLSTANDPNVRAELERQLKAVRANMEQLRQRLQRNRERITQVKATLDQETTTFNQLKARFENAEIIVSQPTRNR